MKRIIIGVISIICIITLIFVIKFFIDNNSKRIDIVELSVEQLEQVQKSGEKFSLYIGRPTCSYCVVFYDKLKKLKDSKIKVYYLNTASDDSNSASKIKEFIDKYNITSVPDFKIFKGEEVIDNLKINDNTMLNDIEKFLNN